MTSRKPSQKEVSQALDLTNRLAKAESKAPSLDDLKSELGDAVQATVNEEGSVHGKIHGKEALFRAWDMQGDYFKAKEEAVNELRGTPKHIQMIDRQGRQRWATEEQEDRTTRKHGAKRLYVAGRRRRLDDGEKLRGRIPFDFEDDELVKPDPSPPTTSGF